MNIVVQLEFTVINMECGDKPANPDQTAWNPAVTAVAYFASSSKSPPIWIPAWILGKWAKELPTQTRRIGSGLIGPITGDAL